MKVWFEIYIEICYVVLMPLIALKMPLKLILKVWSISGDTYEGENEL